MPLKITLKMQTTAVNTFNDTAQSQRSLVEKLGQFRSIPAQLYLGWQSNRVKNNN